MESTQGEKTKQQSQQQTATPTASSDRRNESRLANLAKARAARGRVNKTFNETPLENEPLQQTTNQTTEHNVSADDVDSGAEEQEEEIAKVRPRKRKREEDLTNHPKKVSRNDVVHSHDGFSREGSFVVSAATSLLSIIASSLLVAFLSVTSKTISDIISKRKRRNRGEDDLSPSSSLDDIVRHLYK